MVPGASPLEGAETSLVAEGGVCEGVDVMLLPGLVLMLLPELVVVLVLVLLACRFTMLNPFTGSA